MQIIKIETNGLPLPARPASMNGAIQGKGTIFAFACFDARRHDRDILAQFRAGLREGEDLLFQRALAFLNLAYGFAKSLRRAHLLKSRFAKRRRYRLPKLSHPQDGNDDKTCRRQGGYCRQKENPFIHDDP